MAAQLNSRAFWQTESGRREIDPATRVKIQAMQWAGFNRATSCRKPEKTMRVGQHLVSALYWGLSGRRMEEPACGGENRPVPPVVGGEVTGPVVWGCCLLQQDWSCQASWLPVSQLMLFQTEGTVLSIMEMLENTETVGVNLYALKTNHKLLPLF